MMKKEGVKILQDTTSISAIGIWEALPLIYSNNNNSKKVLQITKKISS